jgi:NRPS condensation-like uncharacterized protein
MKCAEHRPTGRLNAMQRIMCDWSSLHPYNATHTYKLAGPLDLPRLRVAIGQTYAALGLGLVHLTPDGLGYWHETDRAPEVCVVPGGEDAGRRWTEHLSWQLNQPFERPDCRPLRFSVFDAGPQAHYLSATYDHWVADSVAARLVLRHVLGRYCGLEIPENREPLELYPGTYREVFGPRLRPLHLAAATLRSLRQWNRNRAARQVAYLSASQMAVSYELYSTAPGTVSRLREFARAHGGTVHDVILAALGRAMAEFLPRRAGRDRSRDLALGSIVDTRADAGVDLSRTFGTFLAYYLVRCTPEQGTSLAALTHHVARLTRPIKAGHHYLDSLVNMKVVNALWPHLGEATRGSFMRRALPMTAGVSNVLLREPWIERNRDRILGYSRCSPTGPMLPLVLAPTTLGDQMNIGVTYRITGFSQAKIDGIMEMFLDQIQTPWKSDSTSRCHGRKHAPRRAAPASPAAGQLTTSSF